MTKLKHLISISFILILFSSFNIFGYNYNFFLPKTKAVKDSILVFKSETREIIKFDSNKNPLSNITKNINYHIINFDTSEIIFYFKREGKNKWSTQTFQYYSTKESSEMIEFDTSSDVSQMVYLDINPFSAITYHLKSGIILSFENLKTIKKEDFDKLGIYKSVDSYEPNIYSKKIIINEHIKDFEYSEYWRKESFKKAIDFIQKRLSQGKPKCEMVKRSTYNPSFVQYIGNQGMRVKFYAEYDCNQNYLNPVYFWVNAYYLGNGKWSLELEDQKLTH